MISCYVHSDVINYLKLIYNSNQFGYSISWLNNYNKHDDEFNIFCNNQILADYNYYDLLLEKKENKNIDLELLLNWSNKYANNLILPTIIPGTTYFSFNNALHYSLEYFNFFNDYVNKHKFIIPIFGRNEIEIKKWLTSTKDFNFGGYSISLETNYRINILLVLALLKTYNIYSHSNFKYLYFTEVNTPEKFLYTVILDTILSELYDIQLLVTIPNNLNTNNTVGYILRDDLSINRFDILDINGNDNINQLPCYMNCIACGDYNKTNLNNVVFAHNINIITHMINYYYKLLNTKEYINNNTINTIYNSINHLVNSNAPINTYHSYARRKNIN